jgi:hypothetical protein
MNKQQFDVDDTELFKSRGVAFKEVDAVIDVCVYYIVLASI